MTVDEAKTILPILKNAQDDDIQRFITLSVTLGVLDDARAEGRGPWLRANWVAHMIAMEAGQDQIGLVPMSGDLTSQTFENANGRVSKARSADAVERRDHESYLETPWGKEFLKGIKWAGTGAVAF